MIAIRIDDTLLSHDTLLTTTLRLDLVPVPMRVSTLRLVVGYPMTHVEFDFLSNAESTHFTAPVFVGTLRGLALHRGTSPLPCQRRVECVWGKSESSLLGV